MADIEVDYDALAYLSGTLFELARTTENAYKYLDAHIRIDQSQADGLIYSDFSKHARAAQNALEEWIADTNTALGTGGRCIATCYQEYKRNDLLIVEVFDGQTTGETAAENLGKAVEALTDSLSEPTPQVDFDPIFNGLKLVSNLVSPSAWLGVFTKGALDLLQVAGAEDPYAYAGKYLAGDWKAVAIASDAISKMSGYFNELKAQTTIAWKNTDPDWQGTASEAASQALGLTSESFQEVSRRLKEISNRYDSAARSICNYADGCILTLQTITDALILGCISNAIGTATVESGIGPIVGYGIGATAWGLALVKIAQLVDFLNIALLATQRIAGGIHELCAQLNGQDIIYQIHEPRFEPES